MSATVLPGDVVRVYTLYRLYKDPKNRIGPRTQRPGYIDNHHPRIWGRRELFAQPRTARTARTARIADAPPKTGKPQTI
jgi:hypothetical protein